MGGDRPGVDVRGEYSHSLSSAVAYSNRLDRTTATLRLPTVDAIKVNNAQRRAGNIKMIKSWQTLSLVEIKIKHIQTKKNRPLREPIVQTVVVYVVYLR